MSVSHKKINELIYQAVQSLDVNNKKLPKTAFLDRGELDKLCRKIYLIESSTNNVSRAQVVDEITKEIKFSADKILGDDK